ncbi:MAG: peptidylprolyl isomerase, partial [Pseudomonadota bacterium]
KVRFQSFNETKVLRFDERIQAQQIVEQIEAGKSLKDATQDITGNTTDYLPAKNVERQELLDELQAEVFDADEGATLGPIQSGLGNHVVVVAKKIDARTTPLKHVRKDIKEELIETRLLDAQYELANTVDDFLAAGEDLETLQEELDVEVKDMPFTNQFGLGADNKAVFTKPFGPDAQSFVTSLYELNEGEASPVFELADGRMASLLVDEIKEKSYRPFDELKSDLKTRWVNDTRRLQNKAKTMEIYNAANEAGTSVSDIAEAHSKTRQTLSGLKRGGEPKAPLTEAALANVFQAPLNRLFAVDIEAGTALVKVTKANIPDEPSKDAITAAENNLQQSMQNEAYVMYVNSLNDEYGVRVNQKLLDSVYASQDAL